jgi:hypothetical protein
LSEAVAMRYTCRHSECASLLTREFG